MSVEPKEASGPRRPTRASKAELWLRSAQAVHLRALSRSELLLRRGGEGRPRQDLRAEAESRGVEAHAVGDAAPADKEAEPAAAANGDAAKEGEEPAAAEEEVKANGDAEAVKRKAEDSTEEASSDATQEKIAKLKEVAAEKVAEVTPSEPANEEEAKKPEEAAAEVAA